ncbi:alpha/beta fold hydrolase [uncultured Litoreibacter sp.]|uniref:alpha/beta hydrolase family protein n=1 Tax=uncultured Litoreibacter sp. TaxID=1392394 RepID=UPI00260DEC01|nr:alpha/beta fold hydrolase [uncultured Litoreibacter sp.]
MTMISPVEAAEIEVQEVSILSGARKLAGHVFMPSENPRAAVVLNAATGVPMRYYRPFAEWLAQEHDLTCLLYDYRDFGASARQHVRSSNANMTDWGVHDQQAARDFMRAHFPDVPLWVIGHSLGGLLVPFQKDLHEIDRLITVGSGPVHVSEHPWPYQAMARFFWFGAGPVATLALGYLPAKRLRFGPDLPAGVYWQWRNLCTRRDYVMRDIGKKMPFPDWTSLSGRVKFVAIEDDYMVPPSVVWRSMEFFQQATKTQALLKPKTYGLEKIGHIGVFDPKNAACWADLIAE